MIRFTMRSYSDDFVVYRCDRSTLNSNCDRGGGILIAVRSSYKSEHLLVHRASVIKAVFVKLTYLKRTLYLCGLYIPSGSSSEYYDRVTSSMLSIRFLMTLF